MIFETFLALSIQAPSPDWRNARPDDGWTNTNSGNEELMVFVRPGPTPRLGWSREELREPESGYLSVATLSEYDCEGGRERFVQLSTFTGPNLTGEAKIETVDRQWRYPRPGSIGGTLFDYFCGR